MSSNIPRRVRAALVPVALCLAALATLGFPGCPDDATKPGDENPNALTMSNCWPNDDGRYWSYAELAQLLEDPGFTYTPVGGTVPEVSIDQVAKLLALPVTPIPGTTNEYQFEMQFIGTRTSGSGVVAQNLYESYIAPAHGGAAIAAASFGQDFLERLAHARPDLRARLAAAGVNVAPRSGSFGGAGIVPWRPNFIHGYVWIKGPAYIGTYGDVDTMLAWKFLESNVQPGHRFSHQLVPSLASDVWLQAKAVRKVAVDVPGGNTVANAIEVHYLIDYGVGEATDNSGNPVGLYRTFDYGKVVYAPGVGPVSDLERRMANVGETLSLGYAELRLDLTATGVITRPPSLAAAGR